MRHRFQTLTLACALLIGGAAHAGTSINDCGMHSEYSLRVLESGIELADEAATPRRVRLADGRLWIDGVEQRVGSADQARLKEIEQRVRTLLPELKGIAIEAIGIAAEALARVAAMLGGADADALAARIRTLEDEIAVRVDQALQNGDWDESKFQAEIERIVAEITPRLAGEVAAFAVKAALSGDEAAARDLERRTQAMQVELEREMDARGKALERRAAALCPQFEAIDRLENAIELRLADGGRLDLVRL